MDMQLLVTVFQSFTALISVLALLLWFLPIARLDRFRQDLFEIRDELFDYAASGNIGFDDPAYRLLRQLMNGFIRYAHQITFFRIVVTSIMWMTFEGKPKSEWADKLEGALKCVKNEQVRKDLNEFHNRVCSLVSRRIVTGSPFLLAVVILGTIVALCHVGLKSLKSTIGIVAAKTTFRVIDARSLEEEAARAAA